MGSSPLCYSIAVIVLLWKTSGVSAASRVNLALNGTAIQSSSWPGGEAEHAIDGNSDPEWDHYSCSSTADVVHSWWRLELPAVYRVTEIEITNRNVLRWRLNGIEILIGNSLENNGNDNPRCAVINDNPACLTQTVKCWGMEGKFINLQQHPALPDIMHMCEVKVYGELASPSGPSISIQADQRNFTLVGTRLCWSDALLYCRDSNRDLLSLTGPEDQEMIGELVARAPFPLTSHLWVGLRRSITESSWYWMSGDPMDFTQWKEGSYYSSLCGGVSSMERSTWMPRNCGEHLNFLCFTGPTEGVNKLHFYSSTRQNNIRCGSV